MDTNLIQSGPAIRYGWESVKKDFLYLVGIALMVIVIDSLTSIPETRRTLWDLIGVFPSAWMSCGWLTLMLNYQSGKKLPFLTLFSQWKYYLPVLAVTLVLTLIGYLIGYILGPVLGMILLLFPGIYLVLRFQFIILLILDRGMGVGEAMRESSRLTEGRKTSLLVFNLVQIGVMFLGVLALGVGVFVALPVVSLAFVFVFRRIAQASTPTAATPAA